MGKTVPSFRMALEQEIHRWKKFRDALSCEEEKQGFDKIMDMCRNLASESSCATNPIIFEPMAMSILLGQQKRIFRIEKKVMGSFGTCEGGNENGYDSV